LRFPLSSQYAWREDFANAKVFNQGTMRPRY
jgi:hypothetical protein